jgi:hypothetical protein
MNAQPLTSIPEVGLTEIDGEPRARDLDIAERLGFSRPRDIRQLIEGNKAELEGFGTLARRAAASIVSGKGRVMETQEYWLSEEQVLLVASLSKAPHAASVRAMLIRVFVAWRRGHLMPGAALSSDVMEMIRRTDGISRMLSHKVTELEKVQMAIAANVTASATALTAITAVVQPPHPILIRHGKTAGQIWHANGFPPIKITCWFGNRLAEVGCLMEGCADMGLRKVRLFNPDKADLWLKNGGRLMIEQKIAERMGQGKLRLVPTPPQPSGVQ